MAFLLGKISCCLVMSAIIYGCATTNNTNIEDHLGLYEVVDPECEETPSGNNPCEYTLFFELSKGRFIGIKDSEVAYVFWTGDPDVDPDLQYTAHLIREHHLTSVTQNRYHLVDETELQEYLEFHDGKLVGYHLAFIDSNGLKRHSIQFKLKPVRRGDLPLARLNYPENE